MRSFRVAGITISNNENLVTLETALQVALSHHESGNPQIAQEIYRKILEGNSIE